MMLMLQTIINMIRLFVCLFVYDIFQIYHLAQLCDTIYLLAIYWTDVMGLQTPYICSPAPRQSLAKKHETFIQHDDAHATDIHEHAFVRFVTLSYLPNSSPCTTTYFLKGPQRPSPRYQYLGWMVDIPLSKAVPSTPLLDTGQRSLARELDKKMPA